MRTAGRRGYGKPVDLFQSGARSGCGSGFAASGTWTGRVGAIQRVETVTALPLSPSSERRGAAMRNASISICQVLHLKLFRSENFVNVFNRPFSIAGDTN